jgi:hypothetical protein
MLAVLRFLVGDAWAIKAVRAADLFDRDDDGAGAEGRTRATSANRSIS